MGGHCLRQPLLAWPSGLGCPSALAKGFAGMAGRAKSRLTLAASGVLLDVCDTDDVFVPAEVPQQLQLA